MTAYENIKNKILNEGYRIEKQVFVRGDRRNLTPPVVIYEINKPLAEEQRMILCEVAHDVAMLLKKELSLEVFYNRKECVACNYMPTPVDKGCVRTFHSD